MNQTFNSKFPSILLMKTLNMFTVYSETGKKIVYNI